MTQEEALRALEDTLKKYLNCEIRRENEKHAAGVVFDFNNQTVGALKTYVRRTTLLGHVVSVRYNVRRMIV